MEYVRVASIEGISSKPVGHVGIKLEVAVGRKLSDDEASKAQQLISDFLDLVNNNTIANDPATIEANKEEKSLLLSLFDQPIYVKEVPNEYGNTSNPWFVVYTTRGAIKIGWRKKVIEISWSEDAPKVTAEELFPNESVTKSDKHEAKQYIHAWGYAKAKEYLDIILK